MGECTCTVYKEPACTILQNLHRLTRPLYDGIPVYYALFRANENEKNSLGHCLVLRAP